MKWYGKEPGEAYSDSQEANKYGVWTDSVNNLYTPYVLPQENGSRHDVKWAALTNEGGIGLAVVGSPNFQFSAHFYTTEDFEKAKHTYELKKKDFITFSLDHKQHGLGTASCGPDVLEKYRLSSRDFEFNIRFKPFSTSESHAEELGKQNFN